MEDKKFNIEISTGSIFKLLVVFLVLWFAYLIRDVILIIFVSSILVSILEPAVAWLHRHRIPKGLAVMGIYLLLLSVFVIVSLLFVPPISTQAQQLSETISTHWNTFIEIVPLTDAQVGLGDIQEAIQYINAQLPSATGGFFTTVSGIVGAIFSFFLVLVITFYFLVEESGLKRIIRSITPSNYQPYIYRLVHRIQNKLGLWVRGQLILSLLVFILVYIGLLLLQVEYALLLAILAGLLEFIPYIGPLVAGFMAVLLTVFTAPLKALLIVILYFVIQQIENHILVPKIMQKTVGLNPIVSIIALLVGARLGGVIGIILAIPVVTALSVFVKDFVDAKGEEQKSS